MGRGFDPSWIRVITDLFRAIARVAPAASVAIRHYGDYIRRGIMVILVDEWERSKGYIIAVQEKTDFGQE